jgi:hypothetical protein
MLVPSEGTMEYQQISLYCQDNVKSSSINHQFLSLNKPSISELDTFIETACLVEIHKTEIITPLLHLFTYSFIHSTDMCRT